MDPIRPITPLPSTAAIDRPAVVPSPGERARDTSLDPAVSVSLSPDALSGNRSAEARADTERRGFERDAETQALVFRIADAASGEIVLQIPNEVVLKARAYAREPSAAIGERVATSV